MVKRKYVLKLNFIPHLYSESEIEISQKEYVDIKLGRLKHSDIEKKYFNKKDRGFKEIMNNRNDKLDENKRLIEDEKTSKWVKLMFKYYSEGKTMYYIKLLLERIGVKTQRNNSIWNTSSILKILSNKIYIGELDYEVKGIKGKSKEYCRKKGMVTEITVKTQPIIDEDLFFKVKKKIDFNKKRLRKPPKYNYLLNGLLECSCGNPLSGRVNKKNNISVYSCNTNINNKRNNSNKECKNFKSTHNL